MARKRSGRDQQGNAMLDLNHIKITTRDQQVLQLLDAGLQQQRHREAAEHQSAHRKAASANLVPASWDTGWTQTRKVGHRNVRKGADEIMQPRERLTAKEMQVAGLVWEGLTNREIARAITTEQVVKNYLRNTFDKLGVWSRLELAIYVAGHGGDRWQEESVAPSREGLPSAPPA
jgi:DNA-binding CsgD family transcriptional regulator